MQFRSTNLWGAYIWRGDLTKGFCVTGLGGLYVEWLIHGGAYFRNFTVFKTSPFVNVRKVSRRAAGSGEIKERGI